MVAERAMKVFPVSLDLDRCVREVESDLLDVDLLVVGFQGFPCPELRIAGQAEVVAHGGQEQEAFD